jgi:hypothetical protein
MTPCNHELAIVEAARQGRSTPEVEAHLASCADCRDVHEIVRTMTALADDTDRLADRRRLPEAAQLWWKGQLARRWEAEARAVAPLDMMQRFEVGAALVAALILLAGFFRALAPAASGTEGGFWATWASLAASPSLTWVVLGVVAAIAMSAVVFHHTNVGRRL